MGQALSRVFGGAGAAAENIRNNTPQGALKSALTQYINAVKAVVKNNATANIKNVLKSTAYKNAIGTNTSNMLLNKVNQAITAIVQQSAGALSAAAKAQEDKAAANTAAQAAAAKLKENAAAARLKKVAKNVYELNAILTNVFKGVNTTNNARAAAYTAKRGNNKLNANIQLNAQQRARFSKGGYAGKKNVYAPVWTLLKPSAPSPAPAPAPETFNRTQFKQSLNAIVAAAAAAHGAAPNNGAKIKAKNNARAAITAAANLGVQAGAIPNVNANANVIAARTSINALNA